MVKEKILEDVKKGDEEVLETKLGIEVRPVLIDFDKAFRIFKRDNPQSKSWDVEAVEIFAKKRIQTKEASLEQWINVIAQY